MKNTRFLLAICIVAAFTQCSILRKDDPEKDVRTFLTDFQADLVKPAGETLAKFRVKQTREAVLRVINVLQNKDPFVVCDAPFSQATITFEQSLVKVVVPVNFHLKNLDSDDHEPFTFVLWLTADDHKFAITQVDGEGLYQAFTKIKNRNEWEAAQKLAIIERLPIYENARKLQEQHDSVIWFSTYGEQNYFYAVDGNWNNFFLTHNTKGLKNKGIHMGLLNGTGDIIIPIEYDLIGSIGFEEHNLVEIKKDGKVGYFDIQKKKIMVDPKFDLIIPYRRDNVWAVVKEDSTYGWLDMQFNYQPGYPSEQIQKWIADFDFLKGNILLKAGERTFCEIPSAEHAGNGIIVPPFYLSAHGVFDEIEGGIATTSIPLNAWTEYKETTGSFFEKISDNILAVVTTVRERYLEGREEFYSGNQLVFVNQQHDTLSVSSLDGGEISMHTIDGSLLEVRTPLNYWFDEYGASAENNLYQHAYFAISESNAVTPLKSGRLFPQTQYVKLDSSYLQGSFRVYNYTTQKEENTSFLSVQTITYMRDEILASYGYRFPDEERIKLFQQNATWYNPNYQTIEEFESNMTEIDRHNLAFLNKIISLVTSVPVV